MIWNEMVGHSGISPVNGGLPDKTKAYEFLNTVVGLVIGQLHFFC